jgi:transposase
MRQIPPPQRACSNYTILPAEPADHALGRSRGGLSTKIHTLTDDRTRPVTVILTAGQDGDNPQLVPLLDLHRSQFPSDRTPQFRLLADKAYSHPSTRQMLRRRRIKHTIPERQDQRDRRSAKGAKVAGHPVSTKAPTPKATPSNVATSASNSGAASRPATTNALSPSSAVSLWPSP